MSSIYSTVSAASRKFGVGGISLPAWRCRTVPDSNSPRPGSSNSAAQVHTVGAAWPSFPVRVCASTINITSTVVLIQGNKQKRSVRERGIHIVVMSYE